MSYQNTPEVLKQYYEEGCKIICIASGPSLIQEQIDIIAKYKKDKYFRVITINDNWRWKPSGSNEFISDFQYAADDSWWAKYLKEMNKAGFDKPKFIPIKKDFALKHGLKMIPCKYQPGLGKNGIIHAGHHSGFQSINLAYHLGADKIILIGYDMKTQKGKVHWFGDHPAGLRNTPNKYPMWIKHYDQLAKDLKSEDIDVVNCSIETGITQFRKSELEKEILEIHSD